MVSRAPTKALVLLVWARLSSTLQLSARFTRPPPMPSAPGCVRMFAAPPASTPLSCALRPSVRAVLRSPSRLPLPLVPAPPGVRIRMLAAPKRGAAVDSYQTVAVLCSAASLTWPGSQPPMRPPPRREPSRSPRLPSGPERSALAARMPKTRLWWSSAHSCPSRRLLTAVLTTSGKGCGARLFRYKKKNGMKSSPLLSPSPSHSPLTTHLSP